MSKEGLTIDIGNIYWDQRLGNWSDLGDAAIKSRLKLAEQGVSEELILALVQEHEIKLTPTENGIKPE